MNPDFPSTSLTRYQLSCPDWIGQRTNKKKVIKGSIKHKIRVKMIASPNEHGIEKVVIWSVVEVQCWVLLIYSH